MVVRQHLFQRLMPFTISHAVLAPPISKLTGHRLPISAIAIGCMVPDLVRLFTSEDIHSTHLWRAWFYPNLFIGLGFCLVWYLVFRPACFRFFGLYRPIPIQSWKQAFAFMLCVVLALIIGTATHIIWDGLTHVDYRTFAFHEFLSQKITLFNHIYPIHRILQIGTSIFALPILAVMAKYYYQQHQQKTPLNAKIKIYAFSLFLISMFAGFYGYISFAQPLGPQPWQHDLYWFIGKSINHFFSYFLSVFGIGCLIFQFLDYRHYFED